METIRRLTEDDAAQYYGVRLRSLREHPEAFGSAVESFENRTMDEVAERFRNSSAEDFCLFGAFVDEQLVGLCGFGRPSDNPKMRHRGGIYQMYVAPEFRGRQLGRKLIEATITHARQFEGLEELMLGVTVSNEAARKLYLSIGFQVAYTEPRSQKIGDRYYDTDFMCLILS